jgi:predicted RNA-binding protein
MTGQTPRVWTVLRCKESDFQQFLGVDCEQTAARRVKELCEVSSRRELDRDEAARARWNERIRQRYQQYLQDPKNQTTQEK